MEVVLKRVFAFIIIFVVLVVILMVYLGISRHEDEGKIILSGVVEATEYDLSFRIAGQIKSINYDEGDLIDSGVVASELDKEELTKAVDQANKNYESVRASISQLEVSLETVNRNLTKINSLLPTGAATQTQYDDLADQKRQLEAQLTSTRKNLEAVKAGVEMAQIRLSYADLLNLQGGMVLARMYEPGEVVMAGSPVLTIADLNNLTIRVYLPEIYLGKVRLGQEVKISIDSHPNETFTGRIKYISDKAEFTPKNVQTKAERVKQVFALDIQTTSHDGIFKPGLPCDLEIAVVDK
jgi:HlyD family secretion protein